MDLGDVSRRSLLMGMGTIAIARYAAPRAMDLDAQMLAVETRNASWEDVTRAKRMAWWHAARFGMFINFGLYSVLGQHEWALQTEGVPLAQYELLAKHFKPKPQVAREWARLARRAGQKYMVIDTKHHEGFCLFDTKLTDYCAPQQAAGRDLVREFVDAARAEGLRVGFYYSLMDWHHPDGALCKTDEAARKRFVAYTHGLIRELMTNYGKIDVLWYDVNWPLTAEQWESERMNRMVYELQPDIIVNDRNGLPADFSTPEQHIEAAEAGRAWEACMTLNDSWGFNRGDNAWKTPETIVDNLSICASGGGNYLLNIGPEADGSVPAESIRVLEEVGRWAEANGRAIYETDRGSFSWHPNARFTRRGNTLYVHIRAWPGHTLAAEWLPFFQPPTVLAIGGFKTKAKSARLLKTGQSVGIQQDEFSLRLTGLPANAPDSLATVIEVECEGEPVIDHDSIRTRWVRNGTCIN